MNATTPRPYHNYSTADLFHEQQTLAASIGDLRARAGQIQAELDERHGDALTAAMRVENAITGTFHVDLGDGFTISRVVRKQIDWNTAKLLEIAQAMPWPRVRELFKISFEVPELTYRGISVIDPKLKAQLDAARTVTPKAAPLALTKREAA